MIGRGLTALVTLLALFHCPSFAVGSQIQIQQLLRSQSLSSLNEIESSLLKQQNHGAACQWELRDHQVPAHCFLNQLDTHDAAKLNRLCRERIGTSTNLENLLVKRDVEGLSFECKVLITEQVEILLYQREALSKSNPRLIRSSK